MIGLVNGELSPFMNLMVGELNFSESLVMVGFARTVLPPMG
jgi:putative sterol carrier protein